MKLLPKGTTIPPFVPQAIDMVLRANADAGQLATFAFPDSTTFVVGAAGLESSCQSNQIGDVFIVSNPALARVTYSGPDALMLGWLSVSLAAETVGAPLSFAAGISLNEDLAGLALLSNGAQFIGTFPVTTEEETPQLECQRMAAISPGATIDVVLATGAVTPRTATAIMLRLMAFPFPA